MCWWVYRLLHAAPDCNLGYSARRERMDSSAEKLMGLSGCWKTKPLALRWWRVSGKDQSPCGRVDMQMVDGGGSGEWRRQAVITSPDRLISRCTTCFSQAVRAQTDPAPGNLMMDVVFPQFPSWTLTWHVGWFSMCWSRWWDRVRKTR